MSVYIYILVPVHAEAFACAWAWYSICMSPAWIWMRICTCLHTYVTYICIYIMSVYSPPVYPRVFSNYNRMYVCIVCISLHMHVSDVHTVWIYIYTQTLTRIHTTTQTSKHTHTHRNIYTRDHVSLYSGTSNHPIIKSYSIQKNILRSPKLPSRELPPRMHNI